MTTSDRESVRQQIDWARAQLRTALQMAQAKKAPRATLDAISRAMQTAQPELDDAERILFRDG